MLSLVGRCLIIVAASASSSAVYSADDLALQRALGMIEHTADGICGEASTKGEARSSEIRGNVQAQLRGLVSKLAGIGISGLGEITSEEYQNVLREDLAANLRDIRACRLRIFESLKDALLQPTAPSPAPPAHALPDKPAPEAPAPFPNQPRVISIIKCEVGRDQFFIQNGFLYSDPQNSLSGIGSVSITGDASCSRA
jgi:hypothetical protein